jgi:hypothetical protein
LLAVVLWIADMYIQRHIGGIVGVQSATEEHGLVDRASDFILARVFVTRYDLTTRLRGHRGSVKELAVPSAEGAAGSNFDVDFGDENCQCPDEAQAPVLQVVQGVAAVPSYNAVKVHGIASTALEDSEHEQRELFSQVVMQHLCGLTSRSIGDIVELLSVCEVAAAGNTSPSHNVLLTVEFNEIIASAAPTLGKLDRCACVAALVAVSGAGKQQHMYSDVMAYAASEYSASVGVNQSLRDIPLALASVVFEAAAKACVSPALAARLKTDMAYVQSCQVARAVLPLALSLSTTTSPTLAVPPSMPLLPPFSQTAVQRSPRASCDDEMCPTLREFHM